MNGALCLVQTLKTIGIEKIFGYPGGAIMPVYDAIYDDQHNPALGPLQHVLCRHEQACAFAAQGYARANLDQENQQRLGVCMATSGPGATNLITGIADAYLDSIPLLIITGQVESKMIGTDAFQEIDFIGMTLGIVKHSYLIEDANDIAATLFEACQLSISGRPGPVIIDIPKDVQKQQSIQQTKFDKQLQLIASSSLRDTPVTADADLVSVAASLISSAVNPVLIAGGGIKIAAAESHCIEIIERLSLATTHTLNCVGLLPENHPCALGMMGMHGTAEANDAIQTADLIISVGARFDDRATGKIEDFAPSAKIIHVDVDPAEFNKNIKTDLNIQSDANTFFKALLKITPTSSLSSKQPDVAPAIEATLNDVEHGISATAFLAQLNPHIGIDSFVFTDVGQHQMWAAQQLTSSSTRHFHTSGGLGTMGFGLPAAIGAQFAKPDACIINITGDGSFMMNVQELATIKRYQLPIKILLLNNSRLGLVRQQQELFYGERYSEVDLSDNPDFTQLVGTFGFKAKRISKHHEAAAHLEWLCQETGPCLLEVEIPAQENVWPFVIPGQSLSQRLDASESRSNAI